jgi:hypothetical protein
MDDLNERIRARLERIEPSPDAFEETMQLVRRRQRNRRVGAGAVGLLLTVALAVGLWSSLGAGRGRPAADSPTPVPVTVGDRVFLAGEGEVWIVDVATGDVSHVVMPELTPGEFPDRVVRRGDALVAWTQRGPVVLDPAADFASRPLAPDARGLFLPSAVDDRVWVEIVNEAGPESGEGSRSIREMTVEGEVTVPDTVLPGGYWPEASVGRSLLFRDSERFGLFAWDPATGEFGERLAAQYPLASQGDVFAWCANNCQWLHVADFATGEEFDATCPPGTFGFEAYEGAFSPDGRTLALALSLDLGPDSRRALVLVDLETGELDVVDGTRVEAGYVYVDWSPSGESVFITGGSAERQLIEYRPAEGEVRTIPVEVGDFYGMAAI